MSRDTGRRELLRWCGVGTAGALAGCSGLFSGRTATTTDTQSGQPAGTAEPSGTDHPEATDEPTGTEEPSPDRAVDAATAWRARRGTPANTGLSASGGPSAGAERAFEADLRDGLALGERPPVVGSDGIYEVAPAAKPYDSDPPRFALYAYRLSRTDGTETWRTTLFETEGSENRRRVRGSNACLGPERLYALRHREGSSDSPYELHVTALSRDDGSVQWRRTVASAVNALQPVVRDGTLYLHAARRVRALDAADGSERWRSDEVAFAQPTPSVGANGVAVYNAGIGGHPAEDERQLTVLDPDDGGVRWSEPLPNARTPIPTVAGETVYLADGDARGRYDRRGSDPPRRKIHARALSDGSERWTHTYETDAVENSLAAGGTAYVTVTADRVYYALGFPDARELLGQRASASELDAAREKLYGGPNVVALDRADGSVVWRTKLGDQARVFRPMVADGDDLYALYRGLSRTENTARMYVLDRESGQVRGSFGPVRPGRDFAVAGGRLYTHHDGSVVAWE